MPYPDDFRGHPDDDAMAPDYWQAALASDAHPHWFALAKSLHDAQCALETLTDVYEHHGAKVPAIFSEVGRDIDEVYAVIDDAAGALRMRGY